MKKIGILLFSLCIISPIFAQLTQEGSLEFERIFTVTAEEDSLYKKDGVACLIISMTREYKFNDDGDFELYYSSHEAHKIYDEAKIKDHQKLEFSQNSFENLLHCDGVLIRNGKVIQRLSIKDMIEVEPDDEFEDEYEDDENEPEEKGKNKALILSEAQVGDIIEFYSLRKMEQVSESGRYALQSAYTSKNIIFRLIMPSFLKADVRVYNADEVPVDSVCEKTKTRYTTVTIPLTTGVKEEPMSFVLPNLVCVDYLLAYNYNVRRQRYGTIRDYGMHIYNRNNTLSKNDKKALKKIISSIKIDKSMSEESKIRTIENAVKEKYSIINLYYDMLSSIEGLHKYEYGNLLSFLQLYHHLFNHFEIANEITVTSDRTRINFDPDFDAQNNLDIFAYYFPEIDKYMAITDNSLRLGYLPEEMQGQHAIFYKPTTMGSVRTYLYDIKQLPVLDKELNGDSLRLKVSIDPEQELVTARIHRSIFGYTYPVFQAHFDNLTAEGHEMMLTHYLALDDDNNVVKNETYKNHASQDVGVKPFVMEADFTSAALTTQTSNGFILNIGNLIGKQSEYKLDGERYLPVQISYKKHYYREITIAIPDGYTCANLNDFNYEIYDKADKSKATAAFTVEAKQNKDSITIICTEYYDSIYWPVYEHQAYANVVNAAFEFNKKKMEFEKNDIHE
ncbi:hypothetical protein LJC68_01500 [Bacteroidales bacterium OttesenSCG-928-B11]|nr:hypothetical protein [Bacteroidales bacterium OttesenSCG-928-E04]MDL2311539.1 hypothetical protein [Bacteroidales bacterium OttesenSCG-928-B11]MDL2325987.1 hypothetical protein [Bacteroidales bacterium OttesenSCG-928-A14]